MACHCHVLFTVVFVFAHYTSLCFDTVTLKKSKLYRVRYEKRKKMAVIFHFAFLYMYFVPKDLFTYVNNSVSSAICFCFLDVFWKSVCWYRCVPVGLRRQNDAVLLVLICPLCFFSLIRPQTLSLMLTRGISVICQKRELLFHTAALLLNSKKLFFLFLFFKRFLKLISIWKYAQCC